jgi:ParB-like chromosome segregation protein Spo0J
LVDDVLTRDDLTSKPETLAEGLDGLQLTDIQQIELDRLLLDAAIRQGGHDVRYAQTLAELDKELPPVLVHRESMIVLDGVHRVLAARRRGDAHIDVRYVEGSETDAFVLAVRANTAFGKPLTLAERQDCARRILMTHPHWSDRAIAESCGLSGKTVGALRERSTEEIPQLNSRDGHGHHDRRTSGHRVGRDGRARPVNADERRERAAMLLQASPQSSLRAVAREVGLSPATVKDVRDRMVAAAGPRESSATPNATIEKALETPTGIGGTITDVALRTADDGEAFIAWFKERRLSPGEWEQFVGVIPVSRVYVVADDARECADEWRKFADAIEARVSRRR